MDELTFEDWMNRVNNRVIARLGLDCDDLPDMCYRDEYDAGTSPSEMANMVIGQALEDYDAFNELMADEVEFL